MAVTEIPRNALQKPIMSDVKNADHDEVRSARIKFNATGKKKWITTTQGSLYVTWANVI